MSKRNIPERKLKKKLVMAKRNGHQKSRTLHDHDRYPIKTTDGPGVAEDLNQSALAGFDPIEIRGEYLSTTILRERR